MAHSTNNHESHFGVLFKVFLALTVLTIITVAISRVDLGSMNLVVAMFVASIKAGIVVLWFMHLKYEDGLTWLYVAFPLILLFIMIGGNFLDYIDRDGQGGKIKIEQTK